MIPAILMVIIIALAPALLMKLSEKIKLFRTLGAVFLCYAVGIILSFPMKAMGAQLTLASDISSVLVCVAMPLILFSADLPALRSLAKPMISSFALNAVFLNSLAWYTDDGQNPSEKVHFLQ